MKVFKIILSNGDYHLIKANNALELIKKYDLASAEHIKTKIIELPEHENV